MGYRPVRRLAMGIPRRCSDGVVSVMAHHGNRVAVVRDGNRHMGLRFSVPSHNVVNLHAGILATSTNRTVVTRHFGRCRPFGNRVRHHAGNSVVTVRTKATFTCTVSGLRSHKGFFVFPRRRICTKRIMNRRSRRGSLIMGMAGSGGLAGAHTSNASSGTELVPPIRFSLRRTLRCVGRSRCIRIAPGTVHVHGIVLSRGRHGHTGGGWHFYGVMEGDPTKIVLPNFVLSVAVLNVAVQWRYRVLGVRHLLGFGCYVAL